MKKYYLLIPVFISLLFSCINEDFENTFSKTIFKPEYSIALGETEYVLKPDDFHVDGLPEIGVYFYDDNQQSLTSDSIIKDEVNSFNLNYTKLIQENIESLTLLITFVNSFPTNVNTQIDFLDSAKNIQSPLYQCDPIIIEGGTINENGRVIEVNKQTIEINFNQQQLEKLKKSMYYRINSTISTMKDDMYGVRFYSDENLKIVVKARVKLKISVDEL